MAPLEPCEYAWVSLVLDHPLARVWPVVARFDGVDLWIEGVTACSLEGAGVGAIRTLVRNGATVRERLERIDPDTHEIHYRVLEPHALPARGVTGAITLRATPSGATEVVWRSRAQHLDVPAAELGQRIEAFYAASLQRLARYLRSAEPVAAVDAEH